MVIYRIDGVMVSMLASTSVDCGVESRSGQTKDYKIGICCFSAKHVALRRKNTDWLTIFEGVICIFDLEYFIKMGGGEKTCFSIKNNFYLIYNPFD
jgi:hypothetical protein